MAGKPEMIPKWLKGFLSPADLERVEAAVQKAEAETSAEIVPVIVRRSSAIGHLPLTLFLLLSFVTLVVLWPFHEWVDAHGGDYWLPALLLIWLLLAFPLSRLHRVQRPLIPDVDEEFQARQRAWSEFAAARLSHKEDRRGVFLFVSMMERKVVILIDQGLQASWSQDELEEQAVAFGRRLHDLPWGQAFEETLSELGEKLKKISPRTAESRDQLGNRLQMKE